MSLRQFRHFACAVIPAGLDFSFLGTAMAYFRHRIESEPFRSCFHVSGFDD